MKPPSLSISFLPYFRPLIPKEKGGSGGGREGGREERKGEFGSRFIY